MVPQAWRGRVAGLHAKKTAESLRAGNLWLLDTVERMAGLRVPIGATDAEIIDMSHQCARACFDLADAPPRTLAAARGRMARFCDRYAVKPPEPERLTRNGKRVGIADAPAVKRMTDAQWWRRALRKAQARALEGEAIRLGYVHRRGEIYASNATVERRAQQKRRNAATLEGTDAINLDTGEAFTLAEMAERSIANPVIRRGELMTRIKGFEGIADGLGHAAEFITLTCPSRMHPKKIGAGGAAIDNHKYDGTSPREAQGCLSKTWAACRAALHRYGLRPYGFRIVEPHHDATPHWHMLLFVDRWLSAGRSAVGRLRAILRRYFLRTDADEAGAKANRCKFVAIDAAKGTAAGYIAKYVSKNIDGYQVQADLEGDNLQAVTTAPRVEAWASTWGIRQFQQIGGPPVGVWRELRRMREADEARGPEVEAARAAADAGNWRTFTEVMGGPAVRRRDLPLRCAYSRQGERIVDGEPMPAPETRYGEVAPGAVFGVFDVRRERSHCSRLHRWEVSRRAGVGVGFRGSRTRVNNCTRSGQEGTRESLPPWSVGVGFSRFSLPRETEEEKATRESWEVWRNGIDGTSRKAANEPEIGAGLRADHPAEGA